MSSIKGLGSDVEEFANFLFEAFCRTLPLNSAALREYKRKSADAQREMVKKRLDAFFAMAHEERERRRLGIIGRARVAYALQKRMLEAGYPHQLTKQILLALLMAAFVRARV